MKDKNKVVLKFGGSVLHSDADFAVVASEIRRFVESGYQVVAVVSAYYGVTEMLIAQALTSADRVSPEFAKIVAGGEFESAQDLVSYLNNQDINASFKSPSSLGFIANGSRESATPISICAEKLCSSLELSPVVIVPGFSAVDEFGDCILLGRGGSDISAVCIAEALGLTSVRLLKDVDGLYDKDPNKFADAQRLPHVSYQMAREIGGELIQTEAIDFAASRNICIDVAAIAQPFVSRIGADQTKLSQHGQLIADASGTDEVLAASV